MNNQKPLTLDSRIIIETKLNERESFKTIGRFLGKDCTTISKEVKNHFCFEKSGAYGRAFNDCRLALQHQCSAQNICQPCSSRRDRFCWSCGKCTSSCIIYEKCICPKLSKPPYVCNGCHDRNRCSLEKRLYKASYAQFPVEFVYEDSSVATVQIVVNNGEIIDNVIIRGGIKGLKVDEENNLVAGAVFGLFRADETDFTTENALATATSGEDGVFTFEDIPYGSWVIKELSCPEHLVLSDELIEVTISEQDELIELEVVNEIIFGSVEGVKTDDKQNPIEGVIFGLFAPDTTEFTKENALALSESTADGLFSFTDLRYGKYLIKELSCPEAFVMCEDIIEVSITEDGQVVSLTVTNKRISGKVQVHKISSKDHDEKLSGAIFELYPDANKNGVFDVNVDTLYGTLVETETGLYELDGLGYNGYFLFESKSPDGFTKDDRYFYFQISADGDVITVENEIGIGFTNEPIPTPEPEYPDSPQTGDDSNIWLWALLAAGSLTAIIVLIVLDRKKRKTN